MRRPSLLYGWGWGWSTLVLLRGSFDGPSFPPIFFISLSPSRLRTRMSLNSALETQVFVKRASTGNRKLILWVDLLI